MHDKLKDPPVATGAAEAAEHTLQTLLETPADRAEYARLVSALLVRTRNDVTAILDPRFVGLPDVEKLAIQSEGAKKAAGGGDGGDAVEHEARDAAKKLARAEKKRDDMIEELGRDEVQGLKSAVLDYFDRWREGVLAAVKAELEAAAEPSKGAEKDNASKEAAKEHAVEQGPSTSSAISAKAEAAHLALYPPLATTLTTLPEAQRTLVLQGSLLLLHHLVHPTAYARSLLLGLTSSLGLPLRALSSAEQALAAHLASAAALRAAPTTAAAAKHNMHKRWLTVGLATAAGAAVLGATGGLAAPLVAAGVGAVVESVGVGATAAAGYLGATAAAAAASETVVGGATAAAGYIGAAAASETLVGGAFGAYGALASARMVDEYAREVEDFGFVPVHAGRRGDAPPSRLRVCLAVTGWLTDKQEVLSPWRVLAPADAEVFALRWELEALLRLGNAISGVIRSTAWSYAKKQLLKDTAFGVLFEALWPLKLLKVAKVIDNPFSVALARADKAGEVLADALMNRVQGERPVTLIGYSMGARLIRACLLKLAEKKAFGLVESVVLLGSPAPADAWDWRQMRTVVAGRLVNVYSENDLVLALMYRTSSLELGVAGLQAIEGVKGVESVDVSDIVSGHLRYRYLSGSVLKRIGFEDLDVAFVEDEEEEMKVMEELEEKERKKQEEKDEKEGNDDDQQVAEIEKAVAKRNHDAILSWATSKLHMGRDAVGSLFHRDGKGHDDDKSDAGTKK
jgi:hypothetical protein